MYKENPLAKKPDNEEAKIWRYLDFAKFVSLMEKKALYFSTVFSLTELDPFEGSTPHTETVWRAMNISAMFSGSYYANEHAADLELEMQNSNIESNKSIAVNCWHVNEHESAAMWALYAQRNTGIAIQSTFRLLSESFDAYEEDVYISLVQYLDYMGESFPGEGSAVKHLFKRKSFEHEQEMRAVVKIPDDLSSARINNYDKGIYVLTDIDTLIERIYVSPEAESWFCDLICSIVKKYGLNKKVEPSSLSNSPLY